MLFKKELSKKQKILKWLKEFKRLPTSRFIGILGVRHNQVKKLLEELESEGKIVREIETNATYWRRK